MPVYRGCLGRHVCISLTRGVNVEVADDVYVVDTICKTIMTWVTSIDGGDCNRKSTEIPFFTKRCRVCLTHLCLVYVKL